MSITDPATLEQATIGARLVHVANRHADQCALVEGDREIDYRELDERASAIAGYLSWHAPGGPGRVCLYFESRLPAIEAMFGVGRSGHAYVALDANDPPQRLHYIAGDCEPWIVLTETALLPRALEWVPRQCTVIDIDSISRVETNAALPTVNGDSLLYICYTSGSTGHPKGVCQTHRNLLFCADAYASGLAIGPSDRATLLYALSVDAVNKDVYGSLLHGATLCVNDVRRGGIAGLADWLDRQRITVYHSVPTVYREMCRRIVSGRVLPYLRVVDLGGETAFASDVDRFREITRSDCVFVNQLGATEVGLAAQHLIRHADPVQEGTIVPVGRCPQGVRVTIRRDDGALAGDNETGEMHFASEYLSPGYWRRPEFDAAAFLPDPLAPGGRVYRGGDFGRIDAAGNLHFAGRRNGRVKLHGQSVDLMEIEAALSVCPGVAKSAVLAIASTENAEPERLVAYVVASSDGATSAQRLRRELAKRIPAYMLPSAFVPVDQLPLTASGKIDRNALQEASPPEMDSPRHVAVPQDPVEREVADLFSQLLAVAPVGRDDDFFLLGGDSLLGVELATRLMDRYAIHVGSFHDDATVAGIAAKLRVANAAGDPVRRAFPVMFPLWQQGGAPPLFLVHGRHGQAFVSPHFMRMLGNDQPVWLFQARGLDGVESPHDSVEAMAADYVENMRAQRPHGPYFIGGLCAGAFVAAAMARIVSEAGEAVLPLLLLDPPERLLSGGYARMPEVVFHAKMRKRGEQGRTAGPVEDPTYMKSVHRVALSFEQAISKYRPRPYAGPVLMLGSRQRAGAQEGEVLRQVLSGTIERFDVGATHADALDPHNPAFARALRICLDRIRGAAAAAD